MGLYSPNLKRIEPFRIPEFMEFHGLKIRAFSVPLSKLSPMLLGEKARGKQSSKAWLWLPDYGTCLWETILLSALVLFPPSHSPL